MIYYTLRVGLSLGEDRVVICSRAKSWSAWRLAGLLSGYLWFKRPSQSLVQLRVRSVSRAKEMCRCNNCHTNSIFFGDDQIQPSDHPYVACGQLAIRMNHAFGCVVESRPPKADASSVKATGQTGQLILFGVYASNPFASATHHQAKRLGICSTLSRSTASRPGCNLAPGHLRV